MLEPLWKKLSGYAQAEYVMFISQEGIYSQTFKLFLIIFR